MSTAVTRAPTCRSTDCPAPGHQLVGRAETRQVADGRGDRQGDLDIDTGNRQQLAYVRVIQSLHGDPPVQLVQFRAVEAELPQQRVDCLTLVVRQGEVLQPRAAARAERVADQAWASGFGAESTGPGS